MLLNLHVKNIAIIDEADVEFGPGLNVLSGETGAGKSILIDAVNMALGAKLPREILRDNGEAAFVQLLFTVDSPEKEEALRALDVEPEEDAIIISRKIQAGRSICKINDETVTSGKLREVTGLLLDLHGQHEHQSLLYEKKHLEILDTYAGAGMRRLKEETADAYAAWKEAQKKLESFTAAEEERRREQDFLRYEIREIETAALRAGEEEQLAAEYKKLAGAEHIAQAMAVVQRHLDGQSGASAGISYAIRELQSVTALDPALSSLTDQLLDVESILNEASHSAAEYIDHLIFDEELLSETEKRLDLIRTLESKYGPDEESVLAALEEKKERLSFLERYEEEREQAEADAEEKRRRLEDACMRLRALRKEKAAGLEEEIIRALQDLNFPSVGFKIRFTELPEPGKNGADYVEYLISANPGMPLMPLVRVASGGELSRIMLGIKSVLARIDDIPTLIFDEIDTGISGRTAQKVSEKLIGIARTHQVICITHLAQIAAMADEHFLIEKKVAGGRTHTEVTALSREDSIRELARILGGAQITRGVLDTAREMKDLADGAKA